MAKGKKGMHIKGVSEHKGRGKKRGRKVRGRKHGKK
jgi:hypothetical protein